MISSNARISCISGRRDARKHMGVDHLKPGNCYLPHCATPPTHFLQGNRRFNKLKDAVENASPKPPVDQRYLERGRFCQDKNPEKISEVLSFLERIYTSVAENLPDVRDDTADTEDPNDPYGLQLGVHAHTAEDPPEKHTKNKKHRRGVPICPGRTVADGCEERWLPNGTMKEYWTQYCHQSGETAKVSFPTFWRVTCQDLLK